MNRELCFDDLDGLARRIEAKETTCREITRSYLDRIRDENDWLCAFVDVYEEESLRCAMERDAAHGSGPAWGRLDGIPIAVKDLLDIEGKPTTAGSRARGGGVARATSDAVARLQAAGMIVLGKTHTVEYAFGGWGANKWMGTPRNPWDPAVHRIPGGSSSGSAVAVAAALAPCALGTDTGGSVRIPAALNGIVGMKPTRELVSTRGCFALSHTLDSIGPLTRTVMDAEAILRVMLDPSHAASFDRANIGLRPTRPVAAIENLDRITTLDHDVEAQYGRAAELLRDMDVGIEYVRLPVSLEEVMELSGRLVAYEAWQQHRPYIVDDSLPFDPHVRARILAGRLVSAEEYAGLQSAHLRISRQFADWMKDYSALLLPTVPWPAPAVEEIDPSGAEVTIFTRLANFAHGCAITIPIGLSSSGLPVGVQLVGGPYADSTILALARLLERQARFAPTHKIPVRATSDKVMT